MSTSKAMGAVVSTLLDQVRENNGLRSLLVSTAHEEQRPRLKINGQDFVVGLVDDHPMLMNERSKDLVSPEMLGDGTGVTEITWKLQ